MQEVELERHRSTQIYEIEILAADGTEMEVEIDAKTGNVLMVEAEDEGCDKDNARMRLESRRSPSWRYWGGGARRPRGSFAGPVPKPCASGRY